MIRKAAITCPIAIYIADVQLFYRIRQLALADGVLHRTIV